MTRSTLSTKFTIHNMGEFEKKFKKQFKDDNDKEFKGNVLTEITAGVIQKKRLPEVNDVITLIKLGNIKVTDEQAEMMLERWLENEDNKERGITGAFCDLCKDVTIDLPLNKNFVDYITNMEDNINKQNDSLSNISNLLNNLKDIISNKTSEDTNNDEDNVTDENNNLHVVG